MGAYSLSVLGQLTVTGVVSALFMAAAAGFGEELLYRSVIANNMMRVWNNKKSGIYAAMFGSSVLFGLYHLSNSMVAGLTPNVLWQTGYAFALGTLFCAMYLRTKNLWGCILLHTLVDFVSFLFAQGSSTTENLKQILSGTVDIPHMIFYAAVIIGSIALSLYLTRSAKHDEIKANFAGTAAETESEEKVSKKVAAQAA